MNNLSISVVSVDGKTIIARKARRMLSRNGFDKANVSIGGKNVNVYRFGTGANFVTQENLTTRQRNKIAKKAKAAAK